MAGPADQLVQLGLSHQHAGRLKEARAEYERALKLTPAHANALGLLAVTLSQLGDANAAVPLMVRALQIEPDNAVAWLASEIHHWMKARQVKSRGAA